MKVTTAEADTQFAPITVTLVLESQEEVNALYQVSNYHGHIAELIEHNQAKPFLTTAPAISSVLVAIYGKLGHYVYR